MYDSNKKINNMFGDISRYHKEEEFQLEPMDD